MTYDQILRDTDLVMVNRGGVNYKVTGSQVHSVGSDIFQDTDLFMVQSTVEPVGNPQPALYSVSFGTLKNSPAALLESPSDFFLVERDEQLFAVENPFRKKTSPGFVCTIDTSGLNDTDRAFAFIANGSVNYDDGPTPAVYYLNSSNEVLSVDTFSTGSDGSELIVSDANTLGITKAVVKGSYADFRFTQSLGLTTVKWQGNQAAWNKFIRTPSLQLGQFMFSLCPKLTHVFGMTGYGAAMPVGMLQHLGSCFRGCTLFNGDISSWDTSEVTRMNDTFGDAPLFNQDISGWNLSKVKDTSFMFDGALAFDKNIGGWDVSASLDFRAMFRGAESFNQDIGLWQLTDLNTSFGSASGLDNMFNGATQFNQDLTGWCVSSFPTEPTDFATGSGLNPANYPVWGTCP